MLECELDMERLAKIIHRPITVSKTRSYGMKKTVYILGAGCSVGKPPIGPGYPLASEFISSLEQFEVKLDNKDDCRKLKKCVSDTVTLLKREKAPTMDALAARLGTRAHDFTNGLTTNDRLLTERQITDAKIATAALFMDLEQSAIETGLIRYHHFLTELFGNTTNWKEASQNSDSSVLTFNYDRLFEIAFRTRFSTYAKTACLYGKSLLNSGMDYQVGTEIDVAHKQFAFLKLHGSVGIHAREEGGFGTKIYPYQNGLPGDPIVISDKLFFDKTPVANPYGRIPEPLIVFPHEKPFVKGGTDTLLTFRNYIPRIWEEARRLVSEATEIWFIGYSFAPMDKADVLDLLNSAKNCERILIQNTPESTEGICRALQSKWLDPEKLKIRVERYPYPF
jgi:hypothetical protein